MSEKIFEKLSKRHYRDSIIHVVLFFAVAFLISSNTLLYSEIKTVTVENGKEEKIEERQTFVICDEDCREKIKEEVIKDLPQSTPTPTTIAAPVVQSVSPKRKSTSFIPLGLATATTSLDWVDVETSGFSLNLKEDYGEGSLVSFEAFLRVNHSNGKAYARLFDKTHGIAVSGSEITIENTDISTIVTTGNLPIWAGRNNYKVQIKSLNSFEVTYDSGRLKIVH